ncbi:MAG: preprotein translocase subunit SecG [Anaerolineae bacterium]|nr:preprotein translocase subunit SecG [Anaerolineae bacterium]
MGPYLNIIQIIISITLMVIILLQVKGESSMLGGGGGIARTRRGLERTLFNVTIVLAVIFLLVSFLSAFFGVRA